ncbi:MAG: amidohydrolase family protein [Actinomycetota bacterium]|nr:amidohydrolase family protein [Actinomycetota bacterium]
MPEVAGLLVDPVDGANAGVLRIVDGVIEAVERRDEAEADALVFPGFLDLQVYDARGLLEQGVTGYLLATRLAKEAELGEGCLGVHLEGPFLNPEAAGAIPVDELRPVDLAALEDWLSFPFLRMVTLSPELPGALEAVALVAARGRVAAVGHTHANAETVRAALDAGARFATHVWNAMAPVLARATGPVPALLLDPRPVLGVIADGRHLHPSIEELTLRVAGPERIALTSDLVPAPAEGPGGALAGGDRAGAGLVARMARFGLAEAATMASLVPARVLGLSDRGRLAPGFRADLAVLDAAFNPLETVVAGEIGWSVRYPPSKVLDELPPSTHAPESGA